MELSERKKKILQAVVEDYVDTAEPVSSGAISKKAALGLSSATIRNEMSELTAMGCLEQPHTSAGRIPTPKGYRIYVNELMHRHSVTLEEAELVNQKLIWKIQELDRLLSDAGRLTSRITHYPSLTLQTGGQEVTVSRFNLIHVDASTFIIVALLSDKSVKNRLVPCAEPVEKAQLVKLEALFNAGFAGLAAREITDGLIEATEQAARDKAGLVAVIAGFTLQLLVESRGGSAVVSGAASLFEHPEYRDVDRAQRLLDYLTEEDARLSLPAPEDERGIKITIGPENAAAELKDSSVIVASFDAGDTLRGLIGIVGPTRMDYAKAAARLRYIADGLARALSGGFLKNPKNLTGGGSVDEQEEQQ